MKIFPILGSLILLGVVVQIVLGYALMAGSDAILWPHVAVGFAGLLLVLLVTVLGWTRRRIAPLRNLALVTVVFAVVLVQVGIGLSMVYGAESQVLSRSHEGIAFLILGLVVVEAYLTARRRAPTA